MRMGARDVLDVLLGLTMPVEEEKPKEFRVWMRPDVNVDAGEKSSTQFEPSSPFPRELVRSFITLPTGNENISFFGSGAGVRR
jgi:hypothetical protein